MSVAIPSAFERLHFDAQPVAVDRNGLDIPALLGGFPLSDSDIQHLSGAPGGARIRCELKTHWAASEVGADRPDPGLYFYVDHQYVPWANCIGLCAVEDTDGTVALRLYLKDISFDNGAPAGLAGAMLARIVRRCLWLGIPSMRLLAAGGRTWQDMRPGQRWKGYAAWARYGFDMPLESDDQQLLAHFPFFPSHLVGPPTCATVQEVVRTADGMDWWKLCGTGYFMSFDCSNTGAASIALLDSVLTAKGI
jgi:hypothetical protein